MKKINRSNFWPVILLIAAALFGAFFFFFLFERHDEYSIEDSSSLDERVHKKLASIWQKVATNLDLSFNRMLS